MSTVLTLIGNIEPTFVEINEHRIFIPSSNLQDGLTEKCRKEVLFQFKSGRYTNKDDINQILQIASRFYSSVLHREVKALASVQSLSTLLLQYEPMAKVDRLYLDNSLEQDVMHLWQSCGAILRQAQKLLIETTMLYRLKSKVLKNSEFQILLALQKAHISALEMLELNILSDQTYYLTGDGDEAYLVISEKGPALFDISLGQDGFLALRERGKKDRETRSVLELDVEITIEVGNHSETLNPAFEKHVGVSYERAIKSLIWMIDVLEDAGPISMIPQDQFELFVAGGLSLHPKIVKKIIDGFTLNQQVVKESGRDRWNPRINQRLLTKGFVRCRAEDGKNTLFWNQSMAQECLLNLLELTRFQRFPDEWRTEAVNSKLGQISLNYGARFEKECQMALNRLRIESLVSQKGGIGSGQHRMVIPKSVGELDLVAYSPEERLLILFECKRIIRSSDPIGWKGELDKFTNLNGFDDKFTKKIEWVRANVMKVAAAMQSSGQFRSEIHPQKFQAAYITSYPSVYSHMNGKIQCFSLTELIRAYSEGRCFPSDENYA